MRYIGVKEIAENVKINNILDDIVPIKKAKD